MSQPQLRPRYRYRSRLSAKQIREKIIGALKDEGRNTRNIQQRSTAHHLILSYPKEHKHFWSPILDINLEPRPDNTSLVRVLIGPEPSIWTMFMFFYTLGGLAIIMGMIFGFSQYMLGKGSWYFILIPAGLMLVGFLFFAALAGKRKANSQMHELKIFVEKATGEAIFHESEYAE